MFQMLVKGCILVYFKINFARIIKSTDSYWPLSTGDEETQKRAIMYLTNCGKLMGIMLFWFGSTMITFFIRTFFYDAFIIVVWIPNYGIFDFQFVKYMELYYICVGGITVIAFDLLFVSVTLLLIVQFQLLVNKMTTINVYDGNRNLKLKEIIRHHNYLLR